MESLVMNYSDEEDVFPPEDRIESNQFTSRTPNPAANALQDITKIPDSPKNILGMSGFPVVRSPSDFKDAANNINESHRNQIEDVEVVVSDEDVSNCDTNINDIISPIERVVDDQDYVVLCKSSAKAALPISYTSFVEHGASTETPMDFDNGSPSSNKECEESDKENSTAATFAISASSFVGDGADLKTGIDMDNCKNFNVLSTVSPKEDKESDKDAPTAASFPLSSNSLVGQKASTASALGSEKYNVSPVGYIGVKEDDETNRGNSIAVTSSISSTPLVEHEAKEDWDSAISTDVTLPISTRPLVAHAADSNNDDKKDEIVDKENSVASLHTEYNIKDEKSDSLTENSTAVTSRISSISLVERRADTETAAMDSDSSEDHKVAPISTDQKVEKSDKESATLPMSSRSLGGHGADWHNNGTEDVKSDIKVISPTFLVGHRVDTETALDSEDSENHSESPISVIEDEKSAAATLPISTGPIVGHAVNVETAIDSDYSENHNSESSNKENEESDKEHLTAGVRNSLGESQGERSKQFEANSRDTSSRVSQKSQGKPSVKCGRTTFKCKLCSYSSTIRFRLKRHIMLTHPENSALNKIKCAHCPFETKSKRTLSNHWLVTHRNEKSKRTICDTFVTADLQEKHLLKCKTKPNIFECKGCQYKTIYKRIIVRHQMKCSQWRSIPRESEASEEQRGKLEKIKQINEPSKQRHCCEYCSYSSNQIVKLKKHLLAHTRFRRPIHRCSECDYKSTRQSLAHHMMMTHKIESLAKTEGLNKCDFCSYTAKNNRDMMRHRHLHIVRNKPIVSCTKCDYKAPRTTLLYHCKKVHGSLTFKEEEAKPVYTCTFCSYTTNRNRDMMRHRHLHMVKNKPIVSCTKCDYKAPRVTLSHHYRNVHASRTYKDKAQPVYTCTFCSYTTRNGKVMMRHRQLHIIRKIPIVNCSKCDYKAPRITLLHHCKKVHGSLTYKEEQAKPVYTCTFCSYTTKKNASMIRHRHLHKGRKKQIVSCTKCDYKAPRVTLLYHYRNVHGSLTHKEEKAKPLYTCTLCSYTANKNGDMMRHRHLHKVRKKQIVSCTKCDYKAPRVTLLHHYKNVHGSLTYNEEKAKPEYTCTFCSYTTNLNRHMMTHRHLHTVRNKPIFSCTKCDYKAPRITLLYHYRNVHGSLTYKGGKAEPVYTCTFCSYTTKKNGNMMRHRHLHNVMKKQIVSCTKCDYKAPRVTLLHHYKSVHGSLIHKEEKAKPVYTCTFCSYITKNNGDMTRHRHLHIVRKKPIVSCTKCDYKAPRVTLLYHYRNVHGSLTYKGGKAEPVYTCTFCSYTTKKNGNMMRHRHLHNVMKKQIVSCTKCDYKAPQIALNFHYKSAHETQKDNPNQLTEAGHTCKFCSFTTQDGCSLRRHTRLHTVHNRPLYHRQKCDYKAPRCTLVFHYKNVHGSCMAIEEKAKQMYTCKFCSHTTKNKRYLERHLILHTVQNRPIYHCPKCDYKSIKTNLEKHVKTVHKIQSIGTNVLKKTRGSKCGYKAPQTALNFHHKSAHGTQKDNPDQLIEAEYTCKFCSFTTHDGCSLRRHTPLHTVHNRPLYQCPKCDYISTNFNFSKHVKTAHKIKSKDTSSLTETKRLRKCDFCSYTTEYNGHLKNHRQLHIVRNEPIVSCTKCDYKAPRATIFYHYKNVHGSQKDNPDQTEYTCKFCSHTTKKEGHWKTHLLLHTVHNSPIYHCPKCDYKSTKRNLEKHAKIVHKILCIDTNSLKKTHTGKQTVALSKKNTRGATAEDIQKRSKQSNSKGLETSEIQGEETLKRSQRLASMIKTRKHLEQPQYICDFCSFSTKFEPSLIRHRRLHSERNERIDSQCDYKSTTIIALRQHSSIHREDQTSAPERKSPRTACPEDTQKTARQLLSNEIENEGHHEYVGQSEEFVPTTTRTNEEATYPEYGCDLCSFTTNFEQRLDRHLHLHQVQNNNYQTYSCIERKYQSTKLHNAVQQHEEKKIAIYRCQLCSFTTTFNENLQRHLRSHSESHSEDKERICCCELCRYNAFKKDGAKHSDIDQKSIDKVDRAVYNCEFCSFTTQVTEAFERHGHLQRAAVKAEMPMPMPLLSKKRKSEDWEQPVETANKRLKGNKSPEIIGSRDTSDADNNFIYVCEICDYTTNHRQNLINHKLAH